MITDFKLIIEKTKDFVDEYWFDKLNLRTNFKTKMFKFIDEEYPIYKYLYEEIYNNKNCYYFEETFKEIIDYCELHDIVYKSFYAGT